MVVPFITSIDILGFENLLQFPHRAVFSYPPDGLVPFHEFKGKGLFVPLPLTIDEPQGAESCLEVDGEGIPTVDLENDHAHSWPNTRQSGRKVEVVKVAPCDAWRLGQDEAWVEPEGTCRGGYSRCIDRCS